MRRRIYLSGAMQDIHKEESVQWRECVKEFLPDFECFDPWEHFDFVNQANEREVMEYDLWNLRQSDLVIVNFNFVRSLGTMSELAIAYDRRIPIVGFCDNANELHSWQKLFCMVVLNNLDEVIDYVNYHF